MYFLSRNTINIRIFYLEIFPFLVVKFSIYLNRHVFVMYAYFHQLLITSLLESAEGGNYRRNYFMTLRKHAYSNIWKILQPKKRKKFR